MGGSYLLVLVLTFVWPHHTKVVTVYQPHLVAMDTACEDRANAITAYARHHFAHGRVSGEFECRPEVTVES